MQEMAQCGCSGERILPRSAPSICIDHMALDRGRQRLFVAALGNNTVEVIDIRAAKRIERISGLPEPQGIAYSEKGDVVLVANAGDGSVRLFRGADLAPLGPIDLHRPYGARSRPPATVRCRTREQYR